MPPRLVVVDDSYVPVSELALAARRTPVLSHAWKLADWIGDGRPLTARMVLRPATAVEACDLLGIELATRKPRSALVIPELMMVWSAAEAAGFIQIGGGRVTAGPYLGRWADGGSEETLS